MVYKAFFDKKSEEAPSCVFSVLNRQLPGGGRRGEVKWHRNLERVSAS